MKVDPWFPTPVYTAQLSGKLLEEIQKELKDVYNKCAVEHDKNKDPNNYNIALIPNNGNTPDYYYNMLDIHNCVLARDTFIEHSIGFMQQLGLNSELVPSVAITTSWATRTLQHDYSRQHDHGAADISGLYYLQTTGKDGNLYFKTPNSILAQTYIGQNIPSERDIEPAVGKIVLWPGYMQHGTRPNETTDERISIAFNITVQRIDGYLS